MVDVEKLRVDHVDAQAHFHDWSVGYPEQWDYAQAVDLGDGMIVVVDRGTPNVFDLAEQDWLDWREVEELELDEDTYREYADGPMMNHLWPLETIQDPRDVALAIAGHNLCVIVDGDTAEIRGLALTGGGMDLSWDIAAGYVAAGYLPPLALLPLPGGGYDYDLDVIHAYQRALDFKSLQVTSDRETMERFELEAMRKAEP